MNALSPIRSQNSKTLYIEFVKADQFGIIPGSGWVIKENGKRIDWPMLATREEAIADIRAFNRSRRELASDEASERFGLSCMGVVR